MSQISRMYNELNRLQSKVESLEKYAASLEQKLRDANRDPSLPAVIYLHGPSDAKPQALDDGSGHGCSIVPACQQKWASAACGRCRNRYRKNSAANSEPPANDTDRETAFIDLPGWPFF